MKNKWSFSPEVNKMIEQTLAQGERLRELCDNAERKWENIMKIEKVENGYIVDDNNGKHVFTRLDDIFEYMLLAFEDRCDTFYGESYGKVIIQREK